MPQPGGQLLCAILLASPRHREWPPPLGWSDLSPVSMRAPRHANNSQHSDIPPPDTEYLKDETVSYSSSHLQLGYEAIRHKRF